MLKMTQSEVEEAAELAPTTLSRLERQKWPQDKHPPQPRISTIVAIARVLGIDPNRLLKPDAELDAYEVPDVNAKKKDDRGAKIAVPRNGFTGRKRRRRAVLT